MFSLANERNELGPNNAYVFSLLSFKKSWYKFWERRRRRGLDAGAGAEYLRAYIQRLAGRVGAKSAPNPRDKTSNLYRLNKDYSLLE